MIHNAPFDMGFINAELEKLGRAALPMERAVDTLTMARRKFPGAQANLNALCRRFEIDNTHRDLHGALIDADLLASVYIELLGGRQPDLSLEPERATAKSRVAQSRVAQSRETPVQGDSQSGFALQDDPSKFDRPHARLLESFKDPIWHR